MDRQTAAIAAPLFLTFALTFPTLVFWRPCATFLGWALRAWLVLSVGALLYVGADWSLVSAYLRYVLLVHALLACGLSWLRMQRAPKLAPPTSRWFTRVVAISAAIVALACTSALLQLGGGDPGVQLRWPLAHPRSYVLQGGASALVNHHVSVRAQARALDVVALSPWGRRAQGWFSPRLGDYEVYGEAVAAPCSGEVMALRAGEPERAPFAPPIARRIAGNFVLLFCGETNVTVMLAHLQSELSVRAGERVREGQTLGRVGNSGNTSEPHLHVHAVRGRVENPDRATVSAEPVSLAFGRAAPKRGDVLAR